MGAGREVERLRKLLRNYMITVMQGDGIPHIPLWEPDPEFRESPLTEHDIKELEAIYNTIR